MPNYRAALDAGRASCLYSWRYWPGARERGRSMNPIQSYNSRTKKLATILFCAAATLGGFAQGTILFVNNNTWLVSAGGTPLPAGRPATFWFTILTGEPNTTNVLSFLPTDAYATNQNGAGRVFGGTVTVQNWPAYVDRAFVVAGWSANLGTTWNPAWLTGDFGSAATGFFGLSPIVPSAAADPQEPKPGGFPAVVWGGVYGLTSGFNLDPIPEPTTLALASLGAAALLMFRQK